MTDGLKVDRYINANIYRAVNTPIRFKSKESGYPSFLVGGVLNSQWFLYFATRNNVQSLNGAPDDLVTVQVGADGYETVTPVGYTEGTINYFWVLY